MPVLLPTSPAVVLDSLPNTLLAKLFSIVNTPLFVPTSPPTVLPCKNLNDSRFISLVITEGISLFALLIYEDEFVIETLAVEVTVPIKLPTLLLLLIFSPTNVKSLITRLFLTLSNKPPELVVRLNIE